MNFGATRRSTTARSRSLFAGDALIREACFVADVVVLVGTLSVLSKLFVALIAIPVVVYVRHHRDDN